MRDHLRHLLTHAAWADAQFFAAWAASPAREHPELCRRVAHVRDVLRAFRSMLAGDGPVFPPSEVPGFDQLKVDLAAAHAAAADFLAGRGDAGLAATVRLPWFPDPPCVISVADGLVQMALHCQHHRGQLMTRLKDFGGEPRNVDYVIWLWQGRPAAEWT